MADGSGRAIAFRIALGQAYELAHAIPLLDQLPRVPKWVVGDRGYSSHRFREHIWSTGARPAIPTKRNEEPVGCPDWIYNNCNIVERLWTRLKEWRACHPLRENGRQLHRRSLPCCHTRLAQVTTGSNEAARSLRVQTA